MSEGFRWNWRSTISFSLLFSTLILILSGMALLLAPSGRIARETGWQILGLDKAGWELVHDLFGFFFIFLSLAHVWLNRRAIISYIQDRARSTYRVKKELIAALIITGIVFLLAVLNVFPLRYREQSRKTLLLTMLPCGTMMITKCN